MSDPSRGHSPNPQAHRTRQPRSNGRRLRASLYGRPTGWNGFRGPGGGANPISPLLGRLAAAVVIAAISFVATAHIYINFAADLPDARALGTMPLHEDTLIYANDGTTVLADLHADGEQRYYEPLANISGLIQKGTIAIEDANFYTDPGVDPQGIIRAAVVDWKNHATTQGASTITQQLIKLRFNSSQATFDRKLREAAVAVQVSQIYTKDQVLEMYLNTVFYGNNAYGAEAAAEIYFHTTAAKLDLSQASMLAGIPQNPTNNNPIVNWDGAKVRQRQVLDAMVRQHMITQTQSDAAFAEDISAPDHLFLPTSTVLAPSFVDYVEGELYAKYGQTAVQEDGLRVYTTLNLTLEQQAQDAVTHEIDHPAFPASGATQGALVSINPHTGAVVAMVGAAHANGPGGELNMALTGRPPGSSMKIYTYTAAIQSTRYTMDTPIYDTQVTWTVPGQPPWTPPNFDGGYHGICALERCMGNSYNIPAVKVEATLPNGVKDVVAMARTMGAPPTADGGTPGCPESANVPDSCFSPAITLGAYKETPLAMATGASVLGAAGVLHTPYGVDHVETAEGQEIFKANPGAGSQVIDPKVAWIMESIMSDPANRNDAFGATLNQEYLTFSNHRVGVKTGTTDDYKDSWTVGYTPSLATAVWFGNTDDTKMNSFGESVFTAAPAWHSYMQAALDHLNTGTEWFTQPPGLTTATGWHGQTIYLLPGTTATQAPPPLPPDVHSNGGPSPTPSPTPGASPQTSPGPQPSAPDPSPKA